MENVDKIYDLLNSIKVTKENEGYINEIKDLITTGNYFEALKKMRELNHNCGYYKPALSGAIRQNDGTLCNEYSMIREISR